MKSVHVNKPLFHKQNFKEPIYAHNNLEEVELSGLMIIKFCVCFYKRVN